MVINVSGKEVVPLVFWKCDGDKFELNLGKIFFMDDKLRFELNLRQVG